MPTDIKLDDKFDDMKHQAPLYCLSRSTNNGQIQYCMENPDRKHTGVERGCKVITNVIIFIGSCIIIYLIIVFIQQYMDSETSKAVIVKENESTESVAVLHEVKTVKDFERIRAMGKPIIALVHAPWCGHCKRFKPIFESAVDDLKNTGIIMMTIDGDEFGEIHQKVEIPGYPYCIQMSPDGKISTKQPERSKKAVVELAKDVANAKDA